jgi:hypothetical protein
VVERVVEEGGNECDVVKGGECPKVGEDCTDPT